MSRIDRIPPAGEPLEFVRTLKTGTVHIVCYGPDRHWTPATETDIPEDAQAFLRIVRTPCQMLCGAKLLVASHDFSQAIWTDGRFPDDDLCISCVAALGDQQSRAFHVDNRGDDEAQCTSLRSGPCQPPGASMTLL